jgi:multidrug resistance efflux pump
VVGVLVLEAARPEFASPAQLEIAGILANQTTVALRNAQLYHQVPMVDAIGALAAKREALLAVPRRKVQIYASIVIAVAIALCLVRWPYRVNGTGAVFRPVALTPVRALVPGVVERILVQEGSKVTRGMPLATLRATDLVSTRAATAADVSSADRAAALAASRGDAAEERLQQIRGEALRQELTLLDQEVELTTVRAPATGVVLTPHLREKLGQSLDEGDLLLTLGRTDTLELEFGVDQRDITRVRPGQETRLRVDALPQRTFVGKVNSIGLVPVDSSSPIHYPVRVYVPNPDGLLRPQGAAYARVLTDPVSAMSRLLRAPVRWARLAWWKVRP